MLCSRHLQKIVLTTALLTVVPAAFALNPERTFYQYEFGHPVEWGVRLPSEIFDVVQDRRGFLWLATPRGLMQFDGFETVTFRASRFPGLLSNRITRLFVDSRGRLFVATDDGASVYDGASFSALLKPGTDKAVRAFSFAEDSDGKIWLGTDEGLWTLAGHTVVPVTDFPAYGSVRSLLWHGSKLYAGSTGSVTVLDGDTVSAIALPARLQRSPVADLEFHQGRVWGATSGGLFTLEGPRAQEVIRDELNEMSFDVLLSDRDQNLWFASRRTLGRFFPDGRIETPTVEVDNLGYTPDLSQIFEDRLGQHWHTSHFFGLSLVRDSPVNRISYPEGLPSTHVTAVARRSNRSILVATDQGVSAVSDGSVTTVLSEELQPEHFVRSIHADAATDRILLGTGTFLRVLDRSNDGWREASRIPMPDAAVTAITSGTDSDVWIGTTAGLARFNDGSPEFVADATEYTVGSLLFDSNGTLWVGTDGGIASLVGQDFHFERIDDLPDAAAVISLTELPDRSLAAATADHGVLVGKRGNWKRYGERHGLPAEQIIDIEARGQHLWLITSAGVFRIALSDLSDGIEPKLTALPVAAAPHYRPSFIAYCCRGKNDSSAVMANGDLIMTSDDGIVIFDTEVSDRSEPAPQPYLKSVTLSGTSETLGVDDEIVLDSTSRDIEIRFSAVQLARGSQVHFRYRLRGLSDSWVYAGQDRTAHFLNLPPGNFGFELQATVQPDAWDSEPVTLPIIRQAGFLETTAFQAAAWVAAVAVGLALIAIWLVAARGRHRKLEVLIDRRTTELRGLNRRLEAANKDLQGANRTDPLTGLANRRFFDHALAKENIGKQIPDSGILAMLDIDLFKRVNDTYGHAAGDVILSQFAALLKSECGASNLVARWGGEEFLILCQDRDGVTSVLDGICAAVRRFNFNLLNGRPVQLTCSIGCVSYPLIADESLKNYFSLLLEMADSALYAVKAYGRDGWGLLKVPESPAEDRGALALAAIRLGQQLDELVRKEILVWETSRPGISLSMKDTVTRIHSVSQTED